MGKGAVAATAIVAFVCGDTEVAKAVEEEMVAVELIWAVDVAEVFVLDLASVFIAVNGFRFITNDAGCVKRIVCIV